MKFEELKLILKRLFHEYVKKHLNRIFIALILSIIVAASTAGIAWLLDPAVKKIFIEQNKIFTWSIPVLIILAFSSKGLCLYFAYLVLFPGLLSVFLRPFFYQFYAYINIDTF